MSPFDAAWNLLKAIPEQQAFSAYARPPRTMGAPFYRDRYDGKPDTEHGYDMDQYGTVHPAIIGMLSRRASGGIPSLHVEREHSMKNPRFANNLEITSSLDKRNPIMTAHQREIDDMLQRQRGSLFQEPYVETGPDEYEGPSIPYEDRFGEPPVGPDTRFRSPPIG